MKNYCRNCNQDFYRLGMFDEHRKNFKIVSQHSEKECQTLNSKGLHPKGECQVLVGACIAPETLGWNALGGVWYDSKGVETWQRLEAARNTKMEAKNGR